MAFETLTVANGVELAYIDSGAPSSSPYITIVAIHGMCFTNLVFQKVQAVALSKGVRFVAINRRPFPGSTPFTPEEFNVIVTGGTPEQRDSEIEARGHEVANFIDIFAKKFNLPPISADGKTGGVILLGWSLGTPFAFSAVANAHTLPPDAQSRLKSLIRALVIYDPATLMLGLPTPEANWAPLIDTSIPEHLRLVAFGHWVTSYFDHGDISKRDLSTLSYVIPATDRVPTIFNIPTTALSEMACFGPEAVPDLPFLLHFGDQFKATYRKALYAPETIKLFPNMKITFLCGTRTGSFGLAGLWAVQDDEKVAGGSKPINYKLLTGANHFLHWDDPEKAFEVFIGCA